MSGHRDDLLQAHLLTRELVSVAKEKKKTVSLRGSIQKALKLSLDNSRPIDDHASSSSTASSGSSGSSTPPSTVSTSVKSRPAITRQLRAMALHPEVDYVIFSPPQSSSSSVSRKSASTSDIGVVILNSDARLLFRVNWNHAVFATPREAVKPHARLLFGQLRGPVPREDEALDRLLAKQLTKEFGCDFLEEALDGGGEGEASEQLQSNLVLGAEADRGADRFVRSLSKERDEGATDADGRLRQLVPAEENCSEGVRRESDRDQRLGPINSNESLQSSTFGTPMDLC